ncbi:MAG: ChaB family protein [Sphaerochaeta sp.]|nr:ChaB family protein [Sphaerochaeta sp.]
MKKLPESLQKLWLRVFNAAFKKYGEKASAIAWGVANKQKVEKGGEGSGHFGHAGIPGHQGGSLPSGKDVTDRLFASIMEDFPALPQGDADYEVLSSRAAERDKRAKEIKAAIVAKLEERGINTELAQRTLDSWANTAHDNDLLALKLQIAAAEELGVDLPAYTQDAIAKVELDWQGVGLSSVYDNAAQRSVFQAVQRITRDEFERAGISLEDTVVLYRGVIREDISKFAIGARLDISGNALESWSLSRESARLFAGDYTEPGVVLRARVPVRRIVSTSRTGWGCVREAEIIIEGVTPLNAEIVDKSEDSLGW